MTDMNSWLQKALSESGLPDMDTSRVLLGRGVRPSTGRELRLTTWKPQSSPAPDTEFQTRYGPHGDLLAKWLVTPILSARGRLLGAEWRRTDRKAMQQFLLPDAQWNPVLIGLARAMPKLWARGAVWVVEGLYDLAAMDWIIPQSDAVVATIRARLSDRHVELFRRVRVPLVNLVYDNDATGRSATGKAMYALRQAGIQCRDVRYLGGKDPGEIWDKGGESALKQAFQSVRGA